MANICMTAEQAVQEHTRLVKRLRSGNKKALREEAKDQAGELKEYRSKARKSHRVDGRR
jgi:hypothetical protein